MDVKKNHKLSNASYIIIPKTIKKKINIKLNPFKGELTIMLVFR